MGRYLHSSTGEMWKYWFGVQSNNMPNFIKMLDATIDFCEWNNSDEGYKPGDEDYHRAFEINYIFTDASKDIMDDPDFWKPFYDEGAAIAVDFVIKPDPAKNGHYNIEYNGRVIPVDSILLEKIADYQMLLWLYKELDSLDDTGVISICEGDMTCEDEVDCRDFADSACVDYEILLSED